MHNQMSYQTCEATIICGWVAFVADHEIGSLSDSMLHGVTLTVTNLGAAMMRLHCSPNANCHNRSSGCLPALTLQGAIKALASPRVLLQHVCRVAISCWAHCSGTA